MSRRPYGNEGHLRLTRWTVHPEKGPGSTTPGSTTPGSTTPGGARPDRLGTARAVVPPPGVVTLVPRPTSKPFATAPPAWGAQEHTVLMRVQGIALAEDGVTDEDQVIVRVGRAAAYGDLVVVRGGDLVLEVLPSDCTDGPPPLDPRGLTLWRSREDRLHTAHRAARLVAGHAPLGVVIGVLRHGA